jgi:hypothetical protein
LFVRLVIEGTIIIIVPLIASFLFIVDNIAQSPIIPDRVPPVE